MEGRLTVNKEPYDMSMFELSHNCFYQIGNIKVAEFWVINKTNLTKVLSL